jgi:hypothetical protein
MGKYWIEQYGSEEKQGRWDHGNPWFVCTQTDSTENYGEGPDRVIVSIPYHAKASAYANDDDCEDLCNYPEAWDEWLSYTVEHRRTYIREFRNNRSKINTLNTSPYEIRQLAARFVTFSQQMNAECGAVPTTQENSMNNDAVYHLERDLAKAYHLAQLHLQEKNHLNPHRASTVREYIAMVKADEFEPLSDKELDHKLPEYISAADRIVLRKHKADPETHAADTAKLEEAYRAANLAVKTSTDHDKTREKVTETFRKTWVH